MILASGNVKGGVGKTTLAVNLAIMRALAGREVLLVDADDQRTAAGFTDLRSRSLSNVGYTAIELHGAAVRTQTRALAPKYDDVVIDVGGRDTASLRAALVTADIILIPMQPRSFDLWSVEQMADLVEEASAAHDIQACSVLNCADSQGHDNADAADILQSTPGIAYIGPPIVRRKAFPNAAASGLAVIEHRPRDEKAIGEITALARTLFGEARQ